MYQAGTDGEPCRSNSNGTYYGLSAEHVNRNSAGYVDFEKGQKLGLDGIALINVVANPDDAAVSGTKKLQTRITHNDGGTWKPLSIPKKDALGQSYDCRSTVSVRAVFSLRCLPGIASPAPSISMGTRSAGIRKLLTARPPPSAS